MQILKLDLARATELIDGFTEELLYSVSWSKNLERRCDERVSFACAHVHNAQPLFLLWFRFAQIQGIYRFILSLKLN